LKYPIIQSHYSHHSVPQHELHPPLDPHLMGKPKGNVLRVGRELECPWCELSIFVRETLIAESSLFTKHIVMSVELLVRIGIG
jgi:hypothetical protein